MGKQEIVCKEIKIRKAIHVLCAIWKAPTYRKSLYVLKNVYKGCRVAIEPQRSSYLFNYLFMNKKWWWILSSVIKWSRWNNQHDTSVGQSKNLSPRQELNPWLPKHRAGALSTEPRELGESEAVKLSLVMGSVPVGESDFFFVPSSCHVNYFIFITYLFILLFLPNKSTHFIGEWNELILINKKMTL